MGLIATDRFGAPVSCFWGSKVSVKRFFGVFSSVREPGEWREVEFWDKMNAYVQPKLL